jgi:DNA-binding Lrp family transcriptional regulator
MTHAISSNNLGLSRKLLNRKFGFTNHKNEIEEIIKRDFNMRKLRPEDYRILSELMKNARISDRQLAKMLGISQPTVSRKRAFLEKELIDGYTTIPKWDKLGYELLAITLIRTKPTFASKPTHVAVEKRGFEWLFNQHNVIMGGAIQGMGFNGHIISVHKNYSDYTKFLYKLRIDMGDLIDEVQTLLVDLISKDIKPLHLKYLAEVNK